MDEKADDIVARIAAFLESLPPVRPTAIVVSETVLRRIIVHRPGDTRKKRQRRLSWACKNFGVRMPEAKKMCRGNLSPLFSKKRGGDG